MPELPEVETVRRGLDRTLRNRAVTDVHLRRHDLRWPIPVDSVRDLVGRRLIAIDRRAKYLLLRFSGPGAPVALVHLGMSGRLFVDQATKRAGGLAWEKHEHWRLDLRDRVMRYTDARRFGALDVVAAAELPTHWLLSGLGPEPLEEEFGGDYIFAHTRRRKVALKTWLMDARNVVGVGNIYASEACYRAGVRPTRRAARVTRAESMALAAAVQDVLADAIRQGGTTLRDYIGVDQDTGYFQRELAVYGRRGESCARCASAVKHLVLSGRATYYCPTCQR
ncbi:MAG: bifunctional DNA-formamidopyrimidine glycosylase/DNA-(apurinic or apyrimidinic site) lyase [Planctomycetota bacterium]